MHPTSSWVLYPKEIMRKCTFAFWCCAPASILGTCNGLHRVSSSKFKTSITLIHSHTLEKNINSFSRKKHSTMYFLFQIVLYTSISNIGSHSGKSIINLRNRSTIYLKHNNDNINFNLI